MYVCVHACSVISDSATLWTVATHVHLSMEFLNTGAGCHALPQGIFLNPRLDLCLLHWQAGSLPGKPLRKPYDRGSMCISPPYNHYYYFYTNTFFS